MGEKFKGLEFFSVFFFAHSLLYSFLFCGSLYGIIFFWNFFNDIKGILSYFMGEIFFLFLGCFTAEIFFIFKENRTSYLLL